MEYKKKKNNNNNNKRTIHVGYQQDGIMKGVVISPGTAAKSRLTVAVANLSSYAAAKGYKIFYGTQ